MTKYAVLGAGGQLGRDFCASLQGEASGLNRAHSDLTQPATLGEVLQKIRPEVVLNCAAYNFVDQAESDPETAFAVNAWGVRNLAHVCRDLDCVLVHFSTNYVFGLDESRKAPYAETDAPGPISLYGLSKLTGEYFARFLCPKHFVIRTAGLFGHGGRGGNKTNFIELMLRLAGQGKPIRVVSDQVCTPTATADLVKATIALIQTGRYGLYHLTNFGACSWHEFAQAIFDLAGARANLSAVTSQDFGAPARRPKYSVMGMSAYQALGLPPLRPWRDALAQYLRERPRKD
jgi:dTDP-4-dehydrorhamnose reductase